MKIIKLKRKLNDLEIKLEENNWEIKQLKEGDLPQEEKSKAIIKRHQENKKISREINYWMHEYRMQQEVILLIVVMIMSFIGAIISFIVSLWV